MSTHDSPPPSSSRSLAWWMIIAVVALAYANSLRLPFVFDDKTVTSGNPTIRQLSTAWDDPPAGSNTVNRPITNLSFALNYAVSGENPWSYHATNIAIHALSALLLAGLVSRTLRLPKCAGQWNEATANRVGICVAALWAAHPLSSAAITAVAQRTESLCALFYLLVFYTFVRGLASQRPWRWWTATVACSVLGMGTKEVMVTAPLLLLWFDRTFIAGSVVGAWRQRGRIHALVGAS